VPADLQWCKQDHFARASPTAREQVSKTDPVD